MTRLPMLGFCGLVAAAILIWAYDAYLFAGLL